MHKSFTSLLFVTIFLGLSSSALADVRIKQRVSMGGQKFESTRSIKGSRERTEQKIQMDDPAAAAYFPQIATITQCDLRRTVRVNDGKQLYLVEPFSTAADVRTPAVRNTDPAPATTTRTRQGGTLTMTYSVRDTGERKTMFGLQARHLIITQEMESSADSCNGPHKTKMEFDGWYVDFSADFNCPNNTPNNVEIPRSPSKPDCIDRVVTKGGGAATPGFLLEGTMKTYGPDGQVQMTQTTETLELSRAPLDQALFEIPSGYKEVTSQQDLFAISMPTASDMTRRSDDRPNTISPSVSNRMPTEKSVTLNISFASGGSANQAQIEDYVRGRLAARGLRVVPTGGDYTLGLQFRQVKESTAGKVGGIFGRVTGIDPKAGKVDIDLTASLSGAATGEAKVKSKFDGPPLDALRTAVGQALDQLLEQIQ